MILIHPLGRALDMAPYVDFCQRHDIELLEDACESIGAFDHGRHVGTVARAGSFSFYFSHHISTIEGGMIATNDDSLSDDFRGLRAHGWIRDRSDRERWRMQNPELDPRFLFATLGYNVRPTEIQAALGSVQLRRLDAMLAAREALASNVAGWLRASAPWIELIGAGELRRLPTTSRTSRRHSWMTLPMRVHADAPFRRDEVMTRLEAAGVETRPIIAGNLARHPAVQSIAHRTAPSMKQSDALLADAFMIGCHPVATSGALGTLEAAISEIGVSE
jgi:CDP-6-deoxy-D-xylo-4-hexulose-3-dehydrase